MGRYCSNQLRKDLISLYGKPNVSLIPRDPRRFGGGTPGSEEECLDVLLFAPPPGSAP